MTIKPPFFILGCVRSGTTMLRDFLRKHPNLCCPEETHFFRYGSAFGSPDYQNFLIKSPVLATHREIDGISEAEFARMLNHSTSRAMLQRKYMAIFMERNKPQATRWFDKTPQNVYGLLLIRSAFPGAKFIHIVRNPFDVVASLRVGKVMKISNLIGACNIWTESLEIINTAKPCLGPRLLEIKYEDFVDEPLNHLKKILEFIGEEFSEETFSDIVTRRHTYPEDTFTT